jgi:hypothetical protein
MFFTQVKLVSFWINNYFLFFICKFLAIRHLAISRPAPQYLKSYFYLHLLLINSDTDRI